MREILFRGKRIDNGKWVEGGYAKIDPPPACFKEDNTQDAKVCIVAENEHTFADWGMPRQYAMYEVDPATVGQYTGLTDKNGAKIFEWDECRVSRPCVLAYGKISFASGCFWFVDSGPGGMLRLCDIKLNGFEIKVIGNIHDNPELREEANHA